jgi:uncharacterized OB-fold protein
MALIERNLDAPSAWYGNLPVTSRYSFGIAAERFFRAIKTEAKIFGTHCPLCNLTYVPATLFCERCLSKLNEWIDVGTSGKVYSYTLLYENYDGSFKDTPEIIGFIRLGDGGLIHKLRNVKPQYVFIGMDVAAIFKPPDERLGSIEDILYFQPEDIGE